MNDYVRYSEWKNWKLDFKCPPFETAYYEAEFGKFVSRGARVAELGFGAGTFMAWARGRGARIHGIEIQEGLINAARQAGFDVSSSLDCLAKAEAGNFDTIVALDVFEHLSVEEIRNNFSLIRTLLKPTGTLILRVPNGQSPFSGRVQYGDVTHETVLTPGKIEQLCKESGLVLIEAKNQARVSASKSVIVRVAKSGQFLIRTLTNLLIAKIYGLGSTVLDVNMIAILRKPE